MPAAGAVRARRVRARAVPAAMRAGQAPGLGAQKQAEAGDPVRGARRGRQRRGDQADRAAPQSQAYRIAALTSPTERERQQWYFQRYVAHLPAGGEIVLFDRSWYNRAGVERVMGFCSEEEYREFLECVPEFERMLTRSGVILVKYWFSITYEEQFDRLRSRARHPIKQWKLSPMDVQSLYRWDDYTRAKEIMLQRTHTPKRPGGSSTRWTSARRG